MDIASLTKHCPQVCTRLASTPLRPLGQLRAEMRGYVASLETMAESGAFLDLPLARTIAGALDPLLAEPWAEGSPEHRALQLAVLYFVEENDAEPDRESVLGFEDDAQVTNAVLRALGREDLLIPTP